MECLTESRLLQFFDDRLSGNDCRQVAAHLDERRRAALFEELDDLGSQCWMTGTDPALFGAIGAGAAFYQVDAGTISPVLCKSA